MNIGLPILENQFEDLIETPVVGQSLLRCFTSLRGDVTHNTHLHSRLRIATSGDISVARQAGMNDSTKTTTATMAME